MTGLQAVRDRWEDSFYSASQNIRSHGRLYVIEDDKQDNNKICYDPQSKTGFIFNMDYYGWIKSLALSVAGDVLEDEHRIYSVHGACLEAERRGLCLLGGSGAGKTTHTYGLLRNNKVRVVSDDWFFGRVFGDDVIAYGSERNFYIRSDLADIWKEFSGLVEKAVLDKQGRGVVDLRQLIGKGRILPLTILENIIILKRDFSQKEEVIELEPKHALKVLEANNYFNPHLLVDNDLKRRLRSVFFGALLEQAQVHEINTTGTPEQSQNAIKKVIGMK